MIKSCLLITQKDFLKEIDELDDRIDPPRGKQPSKKNKKNMEEVVNNAREIYEIRNYIISVFEGTEKSIIQKGIKKGRLKLVKMPKIFYNNKNKL